MPRFYSIASSPLANPNELTIALTVVDSVVGSNGLHRLGLCSNWLDAIAQPLLAPTTQDAPRVTVPLFLRPTRDFQLPASHAWPLLLIGPGTGVAPFIGFLQHRYLEVRQSLPLRPSGVVPIASHTVAHSLSLLRRLLAA